MAECPVSRISFKELDIKTLSLRWNDGSQVDIAHLRWLLRRLSDTSPDILVHAEAAAVLPH